MTVNRRNFIQGTLTATTALFLSSLDVFAAPQQATFETRPGFKLIVLATSWGFKGSLNEFCSKAKKEGYDGVELWWPRDKKVQDELFSSLEQYELAVGFLCGSGKSNWEEHLSDFRQMARAAATNTRKKPLYINCHSGKDYFSYDENKAFIDYTITLSEETGIRIYHETHRSRLLFAAPVARQYFDKNPGLRITLDASHWCNVSESLLQDQQQTMDQALERTDHIHARIGHAEGPQVNDPRAPEWANALKAHFAWWDKVAEMKRIKGEVLTVLTEFGPPDYMPTMPYTRQPLADQWAINVHMMQLLRKRYQ